MSSCDCLNPLAEDISRMNLLEYDFSQDVLEPEDHPLYIDCVLLNCFKYLPVKTIGTCRLVSKFWNQAACSSLRQRSVVTFKFAEEIYGFTNVMESCKDSPYQRFILRIFEHEIEHSLVKHFFDTFGQSITSLTFDFQGNSRYAFKPPNPTLFQTLLKKTRKLQELKLYGLPDNILCEETLFTPSDFPQLKSFSFSIYQDSYGRTTPDEFQRQEEDVVAPFGSQITQCQVRARRALIFNIMESVRSLRKLEVGSVNGECALKILQDINLHQLEAYTSLALNISPFRSESLIQLGISCPNLNSFSCFLDLSTTPEQIYEILCNMPNLKYLKLQGGFNVSELPSMKKLQEVHLLIPCTLQIEQLMEKFPEACIVNIVLSRTSFLVVNKNNHHHHHNNQRLEAGSNPCPAGGSIESDYYDNNNDNNGILSDNLISLQGTLRGCLHNDGHCVTQFLKNVKYRFPMLSRLRLPVTSETLITIFKYFTNLQELHIEDGSLISDEVITGISSDDLYLDSFEVQDESTCSVSRTRPYIGDLKCLQRLFVGSTSITNASVYYGFGDLHELTSISLREPLEIIVGSNYEHLQIAGHYFSLYPLIRQLPNLVRVEVRESRFRTHRNEHPAILPVEIEHVKRLRPHLQIVYVCLRSERGDEKVINY